MDDTEKMNNREKLAIAVFCRNFLYVNEFITFSNFKKSMTDYEIGSIKTRLKLPKRNLILLK